MAYETIELAVQAGVAIVTLNRPDRLNSFTVQMHEELADALDKVEADAGIRALLLTGTGRGFCAGQDLGDRVASDDGTPPDLTQTIEANRPLKPGSRMNQWSDDGICLVILKNFLG